MNRWNARLLALSVGVVIAGATGAAAAVLIPVEPVNRFLQSVKSTLFPTPAERREREMRAREERVLAEIAGLRGHAWAGVYRTRGMLPLHLAIAPETGYSLYFDSECANCDGWIDQGRVVAADGDQLRLESESGPPQPCASGVFHLDQSLHFVRWGELQFAVPDWRMESWCDEVANGATFPEAPFRYVGGPAGDDARNEHDRAAFDGDVSYEYPPRPAGMPELPDEYRHLLLDRPITGRIVSFDAWRSRADGASERDGFDALFTIDAGSKAGLAVGMHLFVEGLPSWANGNARVESVEAATARIQLLATADHRDWAMGLVGLRFSSRAPTARELNR